MTLKPFLSVNDAQLTVPQAGTIVSGIDRKQVTDVCQMRLILAYICRKKGDEAQKRALYARFALLAQIKGRKAYRQTFALTDTFPHDLIYRLCGNAYLYQTVLRYQPIIERIRSANPM